MNRAPQEPNLATSRAVPRSATQNRSELLLVQVLVVLVERGVVGVAGSRRLEARDAVPIDIVHRADLLLQGTLQQLVPVVIHPVLAQVLGIRLDRLPGPGDGSA